MMHIGKNSQKFLAINFYISILLSLTSNLSFERVVNTTLLINFVYSICINLFI